MSDQAQTEADAQLASDDSILNGLKEHCLNHIDVYPFVLQTLNAVLRAGYEANSCGGSEPRALKDIHAIIRTYVEVDDPHSVHFFDKGLDESPR